MSQEQEFKQHFIDVLTDLQQSGIKDGEAMAMIGTLAADIARPLGQTSWSGTKSAMNGKNYEELLTSFENHGNALLKSGKNKQAYAMQALAVSLVAQSQKADPDLAAGVKLLDNLIDHAVKQVLSVVNKRKN